MFLTYLLKVIKFLWKNPIVISQYFFYKNIPIVLISFNQLTSLKALITFLKKHGYTNIIVIDNASTYPPLLKYLNNLDSSITVYKKNENLGHMVFWLDQDIFKKYSQGFYVVSDPDIIPITECPGNFLKKFLNIFLWNFDYTKVGFSLKIDDIPYTNPQRKTILNWEAKFWKNKSRNRGYIANIDTTFALYKPESREILFSNSFYKAIRTEWPLTARHEGWYVDFKKLTKEQKFYFRTSNSSSSWKLNQKGELFHSRYN